MIIHLHNTMIKSICLENISLANSAIFGMSWIDELVHYPYDKECGIDAKNRKRESTC